MATCHIRPVSFRVTPARGAPMIWLEQRRGIDCHQQSLHVIYPSHARRSWRRYSSTSMSRQISCPKPSNSRMLRSRGCCPSTRNINSGVSVTAHSGGDCAVSRFSFASCVSSRFNSCPLCALCALCGSTLVPLRVSVPPCESFSLVVLCAPLSALRLCVESSLFPPVTPAPPAARVAGARAPGPRRGGRAGPARHSRARGR